MSEGGIWFLSIKSSSSQLMSPRVGLSVVYPCLASHTSILLYILILTHPTLLSTTLNTERYLQDIRYVNKCCNKISTKKKERHCSERHTHTQTRLFGSIRLQLWATLRSNHSKVIPLWHLWCVTVCTAQTEPLSCQRLVLHANNQQTDKNIRVFRKTNRWKGTPTIFTFSQSNDIFGWKILPYFLMSDDWWTESNYEILFCQRALRKQRSQVGPGPRDRARANFGISLWFRWHTLR